MSNFKGALNRKLYQSRFNNFGSDNYDAFRFGENPEADVPSHVPAKGISHYVNLFLGIINETTMASAIQLSRKDTEGLQRIYENLNKKDKELLIALLAFRHLGFKKVKLPRNTKEYWNAIDIANSLADKTEASNHTFQHFVLDKYDLTPIGVDVKLFFAGMGVATDFIIEQYAYKLHKENFIEVNKNDIVFDIGACWGDTALYFANKTGASGKVYSFEFIPGNVKLFDINVNLNPHLKNIIQLVERPVSNESNCKIYYKDAGPGSSVLMQPFEGQTGSAETVSIDDFVNQNNITKVDFLKMDIEGAEPYALQGAIDTIKKFKPKLAIAIYHSTDDFVNIPNWILDLNLNYEIFLDHFTIHAEETVCFARVK